MSVLQPWLVVFDLDGTLIDSSLDLCHSVNAALQHVSLPILPHAQIADFIGDGAATLIERALAQAAANSSQLAKNHSREARFDAAFTFFLDFYREHKLDNTHLYDGVLPALTALHEAAPDRPMAVLTNKPVNPSREICAALGLAPFFFEIYGGNSFPTKKPDPEGLFALMTQAAERERSRGIPASELPRAGVVLVGDSSVDVQTARNAGAQCLGCHYGLAPESLNVYPPDLVCQSPAEWPALLR